MLDIKIEKATNLKAKTPDDQLGFGRIFTDHMFIMDYDAGQGWHDARIVPYGPISLDPSSVVFHYAQECFEGLKAYRTAENKIQLFRPDCNARRMNNTHARLCIPEIPVEDFIQAIKTLVEVEKDWVPHSEGSSLYIRPFTIATMAQLGVHASTQYKFMVICSPSGAYYKEGLAPVKIYVEDTYVRACPGGTGFTKCGGNYAVSLLAGEKAEKKGYSQVLWLDSQERKYVEEVGAMNMVFVMDGKLVTAPTEGSILPGITRKSILQLAREKGMTVEERPIAVEELFQAHAEGRLTEAFGTGTAAVISPVGELAYRDRSMILNEGKIGPVSQAMYDNLVGIQRGDLPDPYGWVYPLG